MSAAVTAMCTEVGKTSFDDCEAFTWSFGCTARPSFSVATVASTSFMFMFDEVPLPVWYTSTGKCSTKPWRPAMTSSAASSIAFAMSASSTPRRALAWAAAFLMRARAWICCGSSCEPEIGKFSTARCVWAR
ncbi:MAG: hypothetical protein K0S05_1612 [Agromyces sp.]|nr:hypothetical protein [Agromyces sp.]